MKTIPPLLAAIILECKVLHVEKLATGGVSIHSFHMLAGISSLGLDENLFEKSWFIGHLLFDKQVECLFFFLVDNVLSVFISIDVVKLYHVTSQKFKNLFSRRVFTASSGFFAYTFLAPFVLIYSCWFLSLLL